MTPAEIIAAIAAAAAIMGVVTGFVLWLFKLATDVAVLKSQMGQVEPIRIVSDIAWIKGALRTLATVLHAEIESDDG